MWAAMPPLHPGGQLEEQLAKQAHPGEAGPTSSGLQGPLLSCFTGNIWPHVYWCRAHGCTRASPRAPGAHQAPWSQTSSSRAVRSEPAGKQAARPWSLVPAAPADRGSDLGGRDPASASGEDFLPHAASPLSLPPSFPGAVWAPWSLGNLQSKGTES